MLPAGMSLKRGRRVNGYNTQVVFGLEPRGGHLGIIVPYRNRPAHLAELIPRLVTFLAEHRHRAPTRTTLIVVEQAGDKDFNIAKLKNVGYVMLRDQVDYVCFHDVDYVPQRADYRDPGVGWAHLVSRGAEVVTDPRGFSIAHNKENFTGGVVLFSKQAFEQVNGYSNDYWGWGFEDEDLRMRCQTLRIPFNRRNGRYRLLEHMHNGANLIDGKIELSPSHVRNKALLDSRWSLRAHATSAIKADGLSSLDYAVVSKADLDGGNATFTARKVTVSI
jgi:N-terminal domain of galactosyltransferase/N-terminal region of glycosyl transferase group 7